MMTERKEIAKPENPLQIAAAMVENSLSMTPPLSDSVSENFRFPAEFR